MYGASGLNGWTYNVQYNFGVTEFNPAKSEIAENSVSFNVLSEKNGEYQPRVANLVLQIDGSDSSRLNYTVTYDQTLPGQAQTGFVGLVFEVIELRGKTGKAGDKGKQGLKGQAGKPAALEKIDVTVADFEDGKIIIPYASDATETGLVHHVGATSNIIAYRQIYDSATEAWKTAIITADNVAVKDDGTVIITDTPFAGKILLSSGSGYKVYAGHNALEDGTDYYSFYDGATAQILLANFVTDENGEIESATPTDIENKIYLLTIYVNMYDTNAEQISAVTLTTPIVKTATETYAETITDADENNVEITLSRGIVDAKSVVDVSTMTVATQIISYVETPVDAEVIIPGFVVEVSDGLGAGLSFEVTGMRIMEV
jgi:hypothetical protein